jgi:hypothetical protein
MQDLQRIGGRNRGRSGAIAVALAMALVTGGCSTHPSTRVPAACKGGPAAIQRALATAPGEVRVDGVRLSSCFARAADQGDVEAVGLSFVPEAERLALRARAAPRGQAALQLGFLHAAVHRGAAAAQVYGELVRRIDTTLIGVDVGSPRFRAGERAGHDHG